MRYTRVLTLAVLVAVLGVGAAALDRRGGTSHASASLHVSRRQAHAPTINVPGIQLGATTCYVASSCSIKPCVVPVASAAPAPASPGVATLPNTAGRCPLGDRVPRAQRVTAITRR